MITGTLLVGCFNQQTPQNTNKEISITPILSEKIPQNQTSPSTQANDSSYQSMSCVAQFYQQTPPVLKNPRARNMYRICHEDFAVLYSGKTLTPLWVAQKLTYERLTQSLKREDSFKEYTLNIPKDQQAQLADYKGSGYDRGHMAPNAHMGNKASQSESFYLTNMIPQTPDSNQNEWREIEEAVRKMVRNTQRDTYVVTGPAFLTNSKTPAKFIPCDKIDRNDKTEQAAKQCQDAAQNRIQIPTHTYKAIYFTSPKGTAFISAYFVENDRQPEVKVLSVCELEKKIGINLFPELDDQAKKMVYELPLRASLVGNKPPQELKPYSGTCLSTETADKLSEKTQFTQ